MAHTWWAVSTPQECRCWKPLRGGGERLWKSRSVETQRQGSHCAWKSRKGRGIPTFPQPRRRVLYVELESGHITCYKNRTSSRANNMFFFYKTGSSWKIRAARMGILRECSPPRRKPSLPWKPNWGEPQGLVFQPYL